MEIELNCHTMKLITDLATSHKLDTVISTLEYMMARNSYNASQQDALNVSLVTLKGIRDLRHEGIKPD